MPTYQPLIPTGNVPLNEDYKNLQDNFNVLNSVYNTDHIPLTSTSPTHVGHHTVVHLVNAAADPTPVGGEGEIYTKQFNDGYANRSTLFWQSGVASVTQMTSNFVPVAASPGCSFLPGGLVVNFGGVSIYGNGSNKVTFSKTFATALYSITLTMLNPSVDRRFIYVGSVAGDGSGFYPFILDTSGSYDTQLIYYFAIGQ